MFDRNEAIQGWLEALLAEEQGVAGSVHVQRGSDLFLVAAHRLPPPVVAAVAHVPHGKGMAGAAQVDRRPVQTCNLKTDDTGRVKPGARAVDAQAAVALPVLDAAGEVLAVVGIAFAHEGAIDGPREAALLARAGSVPLGG